MCEKLNLQLRGSMLILQSTVRFQIHGQLDRLPSAIRWTRLLLPLLIFSQALPAPSPLPFSFLHFSFPAPAAWVRPAPPRPPSPSVAAPPASLRRHDGRLSSGAGSAAVRGSGTRRGGGVAARRPFFVLNVKVFSPFFFKFVS